MTAQAIPSAKTFFIPNGPWVSAPRTLVAPRRGRVRLSAGWPTRMTISESKNQ